MKVTYEPSSATISQRWRFFNSRGGGSIGFQASEPLVRVLILASGGKDSSYATWWATLRGWDIAGMVTIRITGNDSMMFQVPSTALAGLQAASAGIPWLPIPIDGDEATEMDQLESALSSVVHGSGKHRSSTWSSSEKRDACWPKGWKWPSTLERLRASEPIDGLVVGALRSDYQKTRVERMCERLGIRSFTPVWHHDGSEHMRDLIAHGHKLILTSVTTDGLGEDWVGTHLDADRLQSLEQLAAEYRFNVDGEGGEYETAVLAAPWMKQSIVVNQTVHWTGRRGWVDIWNAALE